MIERVSVMIDETGSYERDKRRERDQARPGKREGICGWRVELFMPIPVSLYTAVTSFSLPLACP